MEVVQSTNKRKKVSEACGLLTTAAIRNAGKNAAVYAVPLNKNGVPGQAPAAFNRQSV